jgi:hypothetical protein
MAGVDEGLDWLGPVDYLVVELPPGGGAAFDGLLALVDAGQLAVLDLEVVRRTADGTVLVPVGEVPGLAAFDGADSGLLDEEDLAAVAAQVDEGSVAVVLVYEVLVMHPVVAALVGAGARVLADGPVEPDDLVSQLDEREAAR